MLKRESDFLLHCPFFVVYLVTDNENIKDPARLGINDVTNLDQKMVAALVRNTVHYVV